MKRIIAAILFLSIVFSGCSSNNVPEENSDKQNTGTIYLYGEEHNNEKVMELELKLWQQYYNEQGMRHLFVEYSYYTAQLLNQWMQEEDDEILEDVFRAWDGTSAGGEANRNFLKAIKETCPETVFHGTDVGHQYNSIGAKYLYELKEKGLEDTEEYRLTQEAMKQGRSYYGTDEPNHVYRENAMVENFIREFESLNGESVMGIYGSAHTALDSPNFTGEVDCMGKQLFAKYGDNVISENLYETILKSAEPIGESSVIIKEKEIKACYYGSEDISAYFPEYIKREFWLLEDAYDILSECSLNGNMLPQGDWPMLLKKDTAYMIVYFLKDGTQKTEYHICDGTEFNEELCTYEVTLQ
ncbi:MAG: hypothetical protein E7489_07175 [Ruminococcaceae bacterium]|nr:hypothetical protein [Oscillospiraceae bacterium]